MANERNMVWNYPLLTTSENKQGKKTFTPKDFSYETVGVDFSVKGGLRPFPGFTKIHAFTSLDAETRHGVGSEIVDLFPVSFRIGTEYYGYGFVYRAKQDANNGGTATVGDIFIDYYIDGQGWTRGANIGTSTAADPMDVVVFGRYVYVFVKGEEPTLFYVKYEVVAAASCSFTVQDYNLATLATNAVGKIQVVDTTSGGGGGTSGQVVAGDVIRLPASDGTLITCTIHADTTTSGATDGSVTAAVVSGNNGTMATNIATAINYNSKFSATVVDTEYVSITQLHPSAEGNTTITLSLGTEGVITITDQFAGGVGDSFKVQMTDPIDDVATLYPIAGTGTNVPTDGDVRWGTFKVETDNNTTADNFATCLHASGDWTAPNPAANQVTITQVLPGAGGNRITTLTQANSGFATKSNFSGGTGVVAGAYQEIIETDTGPGVQMEVVEPNSTNSVAVGTLSQATLVDKATPGYAQVFTGTTVGSHWDTTPEDMDDVASLEAGNYAVGFVLTDPDTGRKTSLSKLAQIKQEHLVTKATGRITVGASGTKTNLNADTITINDGSSTVIFTFDNTTDTDSSTSATEYKIGTSSDSTIEQLAISIYNSINLAKTNKHLNITPTDPEEGSAGTANFTFGASTFDDSNVATITLIDSATTSRVYKIKNDYSADPTNQEFEAGADATTAALNFKQIVESSDGHNGTITVSVVAGAVTITQAITGNAGNTVIADSGWDAICDVNVGGSFTGGSNAFIDLTHAKGTVDGNQTIETTESVAANLVVSGMSGASNFDPGYVGIEIVYDSTKFSRARIYRSVRVQDAGGSYAASIVQLDKIITLADYVTTDQTADGVLMGEDFKRAIYYFRLPDLALIYQDPYIDRSVFDENMPKAGAGIEFDGILLASNIEGSGSAGAASEEGSFDQYRGLGEFRWSSMAETSPELFPPENYHVPSKIANQVQRFVRSGGVVLGFANNVVMHISREFTGVTSYMKVLPIHEGFGIINRKALQSVGPFTYYVNDKGVKTIDAQARLDSLHALDGIIEDWRTDFDSLSMGYDSQGSVLFIMNSAKQEAALLWMNTSSVSELYDMPFDEVVTGQWPSNLKDSGSDLTERAFFVQNQPDFTDTNADFDACVWVMDAKREKLLGSSTASDFNGTYPVRLLDEGKGDSRFLVASWDPLNKRITIDNTTQGHQSVVPTMARSAAQWVGAYVYVIGVADTTKEGRIGTKAQIQSCPTGTTIDLITSLSLSAGDTIGLSPVYMKWSGSLLGYNDPVDPQSPTPTGLHIARTIDSIGSYFSSVNGAASVDTVNTKDSFYKGSIFEGDSETASSTAIPVDLSGDYVRSIEEGESTYWAGFETHGVRGIAASPGIEVFCPDLDFRLLSVIIEGKIVPTFRTERPS